MSKPFAVVTVPKPQDEFARTMRLANEIRVDRERLEASAIHFVRNASGALPERLRKASELSGIPRGVIEELLKARAQ